MFIVFEASGMTLQYFVCERCYFQLQLLLIGLLWACRSVGCVNLYMLTGFVLLHFLEQILQEST